MQSWKYFRTEGNKGSEHSGEAVDYFCQLVNYPPFYAGAVSVFEVHTAAPVIEIPQQAPTYPPSPATLCTFI